MLDLFNMLLWKKFVGGEGGGGDITLTTLNVSSNGTTNAPSGTAYNKVISNVPNTYAAGDEGKVVSNGALVAQTAHATVTQNGTVDTTLNNSVEVNVSGGGDSVIQMRGDYTLAALTDLTNPIRIKNYSSGAAFSCAITYANQSLGGLILDFSGAKIDVAGSGMSSGANNGAIKQIISSDGTGTFNISGGGQTFRNQKYLTDITVRTTKTATNSDRTFLACTALKFVNWVHNSITAPLTMADCSSLTNDGLIAVANGLKESATGALTLHSTPKGRLSSIVGTVSTETTGSTTYSVFTASENGTVTLTDFITNTKGWTIA